MNDASDHPHGDAGQQVNDSVHPFAILDPSFILDAIETAGYQVDGRVTALNSYENRVYQIGIEDDLPLIAKFYRPNRWSKAQILEEHQFTNELVEADLPVICALKKQQQSLFSYQDFYFSLYPRKGGRAPELDNDENLFILGRFLGRLHSVGANSDFQHRPSITSQTYGHESVQLISEKFIPSDLKTAYDTLTADLLSAIDGQLDECAPYQNIRVHGDCHIGNILWRDDIPHFIDFDDSRMAPAIQDIWMLRSGSKQEQQQQLLEVLDGYSEFAEFNSEELRLVEILRTLRMLYFSAWLARRWDDPAFPMGFPWFNTNRYWEEHILSLREQLFALSEPPLSIDPYNT